MTKTPLLLKPVLAILCCGAAITGTSPIWGIPGPVLVYQRPIDAMVDVTNDLGVAVLQDYAYTRSNFAFSPYGVVSVLVVLYEGARGESARQIHNVLRLPWNRDVTRIGFRDIHRHLRGYFSHEGYLSGLTLNKLNTSLLPEYRRVLRFYGYDVGLADEPRPFPPMKPPTTTTTTSAPETEPATPAVVQETTKPVTEQTTLTTLVSEEDTTPPEESSVGDTSTNPTTDFSTTLPTTIMETSEETAAPTTATESTLTDATKAEAPTTTEGPSTGFTNVEETSTTAETTFSEQPISTTIPPDLEKPTTMVAEDTSAPVMIEETSTIEAATTKAAVSPTQPITSTVPTSLEEITTITRSTEPVFTSPVSEPSTDESTTKEQPDTTTIPTSLPEATTAQGLETASTGTKDTDTTPVTESSDHATTNADLLPGQTDTATEPTTLPEVTTAQDMETGSTGTRGTTPVSDSSTDYVITDTTTSRTTVPEITTDQGLETSSTATRGTAATTETSTSDATTKTELLTLQPDTTTAPATTPEVTTGFTDPETTTMPVMATSPDAETTATLLPEQSTSGTPPTTLEDGTAIQTTTSASTDQLQEYTSPTSSVETSSVNAELRAVFLQEELSTVPNTLKEITTLVDNTNPVFTDMRNAEIASELPSTSTIPVMLETVTTAMEDIELAAARLQLPTTRVNPGVQRETTVTPMETPISTTPVDFTATYSGDSSPETHTDAVALSVPEGNLSSRSENSPEVAEIRSRTAKMLSPTNSSTLFVGRSSIDTETASATAAASLSKTEPANSHKPEVVTVGSESNELKLAPRQGKDTSLEGEHKENFILELASVFTKALGAIKNESGLEIINSTKREANADSAEINSTSAASNYTMTNKSYSTPLTHKNYEDLGERPLAKNRRRRRSVAEEPVVFFPDISLQLQNGMFDSQVSRGYDLFGQLHKRPFLIDGATEELVPMMSYTAVFQYAYIQSLHAQALEFPLDDERYRLLILLPVERRGLRQLIYDLNSCPLRSVFQAMKPTRVQAIIPSFMVEGFVILTPTLQQLGVWDVFDPRRADLSGMSSDPELYVRNIEQAVTVVIRNYVKILDIQTRTLTARTMLQLFAATHPFLYFVVDTDTHVSLMAGKMVDPLNSRIY